MFINGLFFHDDKTRHWQAKNRSFITIMNCTFSWVRWHWKLIMLILSLSTLSECKQWGKIECCEVLAFSCSVPVWEQDMYLRIYTFTFASSSETICSGLQLYLENLESLFFCQLSLLLNILKHCLVSNELLRLVCREHTLCLFYTIFWYVSVSYCLFFSWKLWFYIFFNPKDYQNCKLLLCVWLSCIDIISWNL